MVSAARLQGPMQQRAPLQPASPPASAAAQPPMPRMPRGDDAVPDEGPVYVPDNRPEAPAWKPHRIRSAPDVMSSSTPLQNRAAPVNNSSRSLRIHQVDDRFLHSGRLQNLATDQLPQQSAARDGMRAADGRQLINRIMQQHQGSDVVLHVYDLHRYTKNSGLFHLGIEVYGMEIFFSTDGIVSCRPGGHQAHVHRLALPVGRTSMSVQQVQDLLSVMSQEWTKGIYRIMDNNCQTFAVAFCQRLGLPNDCVPAEYCRHSDVGSRWRGTLVGSVTSALAGKVFSSAGSMSSSVSAPSGTPERR